MDYPQQQQNPANIRTERDPELERRGQKGQLDPALSNVEQLQQEDVGRVNQPRDVSRGQQEAEDIYSGQQAGDIYGGPQRNVAPRSEDINK